MSGLSQQNYDRVVENSNQGIVDGRAVGEQPSRAPVTLDTVVDKNASAQDPPSHTSAADTLTGATSAEVHESMGKPGSGMTSTELHHDGQQGRKKAGLGEGQWKTDA